MKHKNITAVRIWEITTILALLLGQVPKLFMMF